MRSTHQWSGRLSNLPDFFILSYHQILNFQIETKADIAREFSNQSNCMARETHSTHTFHPNWLTQQNTGRVVRIETFILTYVKFKPASITHPWIEKDLLYTGMCQAFGFDSVIVAISKEFWHGVEKRLSWLL